MSYSGDAAEQVVRMSLEGTEVAVKIAGEGAKQAAVLIYAILQQQQKTQGKTRLTNMLKSGKELKVFAVRDGDLGTFCRVAKTYGVLYCVLKDRDAIDGLTDIMVRAEDAAKVNRIFERFNLSTVDMRQETQQPRAENNLEQFLDELLKPVEEKTNPATARAESATRSEPIFERGETSEASIEDKQNEKRPSVRKLLNEIRQQRQGDKGKIQNNMKER